MKTRLLFAALVITTGSLSAQTYYQLLDITGADVGDTVTAQGPNQLVPALVVTATCVQTQVYLDANYQVQITQNVFPVDPASRMPGFLIGQGGRCQQPATIKRRTYSMVIPTINPIPGVGSEMQANWMAFGLPYELHRQIQMTCDGLVLNIRPVLGPFPC